MRKKTIKIIIALILFFTALIVKFNNVLINNCLLSVSYLIVGIEILKKAFRNIIRGKVFDENFLMSIATIGAFLIGEIPEAVAVMLFYQIGELFQSYAVDKSRKSISELMNIRPDYANRYINDEIVKVDPGDIKIGEVIIVKPGEKVPLDGVILEGETTLDTKALTGESVPREAIEGEEVYSGSINLTKVVKIKVSKEYGESTVSKILNLVESASSKKSKSENFITKFAKYYTPIVVVIAVFLAIVPPIIMAFLSLKGQSIGNEATLIEMLGVYFPDWIYRALSFLVVSCPCALVISIPLSFFGGIGGASKMGVLIKGSNYLEALANTETIVFDKTGTLTKGEFKVQEIKPINLSEEELLEIVAYSENYSNHPISKSIKEAYKGEIDKSKIIETKEIAGRGISAKIEEKEVLVGNAKLMLENGVEFSKCEGVGTILYVAIDKNYAGYILISDTIKEDAKKIVEGLKKNGIKQVVMLTGDRKDVGEDVAKKLDIDEVYTELLPDGKVEKVEELLKTKSEKGKLAFVGDGINDAPVLAISDIGIAMGGLGADSAIEAADIVIMNDEPSKIINAIKLSRKTLKIVRENITFAIVVKIAILILTAIGLSTMWWAVFADVGVSIIAIINALRVLRIKL